MYGRVLYLDQVQPPPPLLEPEARNSTKPSHESGPVRTRRNSTIIKQSSSKYT